MGHKYYAIIGECCGTEDSPGKMNFNGFIITDEKGKIIHGSLQDSFSPKEILAFPRSEIREGRIMEGSDGKVSDISFEKNYLDTYPGRHDSCYAQWENSHLRGYYQTEGEPTRLQAIIQLKRLHRPVTTI